MRIVPDQILFPFCKKDRRADSWIRWKNTAHAPLLSWSEKGMRIWFGDLNVSLWIIYLWTWLHTSSSSFFFHFFSNSKLYHRSISIIQVRVISFLSLFQFLFLPRVTCAKRRGPGGPQRFNSVCVCVCVCVCVSGIKLLSHHATNRDQVCFCRQVSTR